MLSQDHQTAFRKQILTTVHTAIRISSLGYPDSNQERQDQNLQCYHYTISQNHLHRDFLSNAMQRYKVFLNQPNFYVFFFKKISFLYVFNSYKGKNS